MKEHAVRKIKKAEKIVGPSIIKIKSNSEKISFFALIINTHVKNAGMSSLT